MKQFLTALVVKTAMLLWLSDRASATYDKNCYKKLASFGEPILDTDVITTDLDKIKQLADPDEFRFGSVTFCLLPGSTKRLTAQRFGVSNNKETTGQFD